MRQLTLSKEQQADYASRISKELEKMTMSWDNMLSEWHPVAIKALEFANVRVMQIPQNKFIDLFKEDVHGLGMNVVQVLCNNLEDRSAIEMGVSAKEWANFLKEKNYQIGLRWTNMIIPVQKRINKEFEIMNGRDAGLRLIKAEA